MQCVGLPLWLNADILLCAEIQAQKPMCKHSAQNRTGSVCLWKCTALCRAMWRYLCWHTVLKLKQCSRSGTPSSGALWRYLWRHTRLKKQCCLTPQCSDVASTKSRLRLRRNDTTDEWWHTHKYYERWRNPYANVRRFRLQQIFPRRIAGNEKLWRNIRHSTKISDINNRVWCPKKRYRCT